jgi:isoquinoline 1-oxidoreductase
MTDERDLIAIEPERYEFSAPPKYLFQLTRRRFVEAMGAGVVVMVVPRRAVAWTGSTYEELQQSAGAISAWLHIAEDGAITVFTGKVEVGQDIRTSLTQAVAEELKVAPSSITMVMGDTDRVPYDAGTFGSRSTPQMGSQLRRAAAAARAVLLARAAERWSVDASSLEFSEGQVRDTSSGRSARIGELTTGAQLVETVAESATTSRPVGESLRKITGREIVTGRHRYTSDLVLPGMRIGKVLRPPAHGAVLATLDASAAEAIPGVVVVRDGDFAGVTAPDEATAIRALSALRANWTAAPAQPTHDTIFEHLERTGGAGTPNERGSVEQALAQADPRFDAKYTTAYIAHVPLEPRAALAQWENDKLTVWTGTQRPFGVRSELARAFTIPEERVRVHVPDTGSAYGGKHSGEAAIEAARLARSAGHPVRLVWTREEEFTWAYFRPAAVIQVRSGVLADGKLSAWDFHNYNSGTAGIGMPYDVPNTRTQFHTAESPLRQGSYRALAATANTFARESHMDEVAVKLGVDPVEFRRRHLSNERLRAVLDAAAERFTWTNWSPTPGHGIGSACGTEKGGYVATCAEVAVDPSSGRVRIVRIVEAFECGAIVNPDGLRNQVEGAIVQGLGGALWEAVEFAEGRILNPRLSQYRVPRMSDLPPIEVVLVQRQDLPSAGAGETPIITLAPALGNAIFRATGVRLRALPLAPHGMPG